MGIWNPNDYDIKNAIQDMFRKGREVSFDEGGFVQKVDVQDDGTAFVSWYAPNNSDKQHWHFIFQLDSDGKIIPNSGRFV
jgi:hypothetical protein